MNIEKIIDEIQKYMITFTKYNFDVTEHTLRNDLALAKVCVCYLKKQFYFSEEVKTLLTEQLNNWENQLPSIIKRLNKNNNVENSDDGDEFLITPFHYSDIDESPTEDETNPDYIMRHPEENGDFV